MKATLTVMALLTAAVAFGFDSAAWMSKRASMFGEAMRLQTAYSNCLVKVTEAASGVVVPLETFEDGSIKLEIRAKRAQIFLKEGLVWAEDVIISKYEDTKELASRIEAGHCLIDRIKKCGWVEGAAKLTIGKTVFTGENVYFSSVSGYVLALKKSHIETTDMKLGGAL